MVWRVHAAVIMITHFGEKCKRDTALGAILVCLTVFAAGVGGAAAEHLRCGGVCILKPFPSRKKPKPKPKP